MPIEGLAQCPANRNPWPAGAVMGSQSKSEIKPTLAQDLLPQKDFPPSPALWLLLGSD